MHGDGERSQRGRSTRPASRDSLGRSSLERYRAEDFAAIECCRAMPVLCSASLFVARHNWGARLSLSTIPPPAAALARSREGSTVRAWVP